MTPKINFPVALAAILSAIVKVYPKEVTDIFEFQVPCDIHPSCPVIARRNNDDMKYPYTMRLLGVINGYISTTYGVLLCIKYGNKAQSNNGRVFIASFCIKKKEDMVGFNPKK